MVTLNDKVRNVLTERYTDDFNSRIDPAATFEDVWIAISNRDNVYGVLGIGDSLIREHTFEVLSGIMDVPYEMIYLVWLYGYRTGIYEYERRQKAGITTVTA